MNETGQMQSEQERKEALRDALTLGGIGAVGAGATGAYIGGKARGKTVRTLEEILRSLPKQRTWQLGGAAALGIPAGLSTLAAAAANHAGYSPENDPLRGAAVGAVTGGLTGALAGEAVRNHLLFRSPALGIGRAMTTVPIGLAGLGLGGALGAGAGFIQRAKARKHIKQLLNDGGAEEQA